ncbi:hypothetical protein Bca52824_074452 [Brassica carinata]|uniref:Uncharacterized protein n=1 Tax=Brassica carinata TaxID=52824 RepID=A0A8X7PQK2_BRACI|nr:hypothetical protein Bca52824_074452 [Brassica carinata]
MAVATAPSLNRHFLSRVSSPFSRVKRRRLWLLQGDSNLFDSRRNRLLVFASSSNSPTDALTAESCVNTGLDFFKRGRVKDALVEFETALSLDPNPIESQAAYYNKACCHAYRGEGNKAADCLRVALRDYNLKFATILNDPDLASFRALPEFKQLQEEVSFYFLRFKKRCLSHSHWLKLLQVQARLGGEDIGDSFRRDLKLISEVRAPFRGFRKFFYFAFSAAAGISTLFTIPRLIQAVRGGDGAPDLLETTEMLPLTLEVGIVVLVAFFIFLERLI